MSRPINRGPSDAIVAWTGEDGVARITSISHYAYAQLARDGEVTDDRVRAYLRQELPKGGDYQRSQPADVSDTDWRDLPDDSDFRGAWRVTAGRVEVDMPVARQIHRQRLEQRAAERARELREAYLEADEDGDTARAQQIRQRVRAMRQRIAALDLDAAQTPEELAAITDDELEPARQPLRGAR